MVPNAWKIATYVSFVVIVGLAVLNIVGGGKQLYAGDIGRIRGVRVLGKTTSKKYKDVDLVNEREPSHSVHYSDLGEVLERAVQNLPEDQKAVVMLRDYEGYSYKEIAGITDLSETQVKVYIYRARVFLKNFIGSMEQVI